MKFISFEIRNFKGIKHTKIELNKTPKSDVYTLVGLNESGKTTILEAISYLIAGNDNDYKDLFDKTSYSSLDNPNDLIPLSERDFFDKKILVKAILQLDNQDIKSIEEYAKSLDFLLDTQKLNKPFSITRNASFLGERPKTTTLWDIKLVGKSKRAKKIKELDASDDNWQKIIVYIKKIMPKILFFPTFLFDFPQKIYLDDSHILDRQTKKINSYYKSILQDIIDNLYNGQTIDSLITNRLRSGSEAQEQAVDSTLLKMSQQISTEVFELWNKIFQVQSTTKNINIKAKSEEISVDEDDDEKEKIYYLEFQITEGMNIYNINQRSLGFRWFFCFLLFTHIRIKRNNTILFLFDEPASNLHSSAQRQLLDCFSKITDKNSQIIYSTHSHYMLNPQWLENAYIVENKGLRNEITDINDYNAVNTDIKAQPYRRFVNEHPDKTNYFQPILDLLQFQPCELENIPNVAMLEGKTDFYFIKYFAKYLKKNENLHVLPGLGAGELSPLISLYIGWGRDFIVILDGDNAGLKAKSFYQDSFMLPEHIVFTLKDIEPKWTTIENLITVNDKIAINQGKKPTKRQLDRIIQELLARDNFDHKFEDATLSNMQKLIEFIKNNLPN